jgi:hypothetical protein
MTDFKTETRTYCRHPKCRSKLPSPVTNPREAFCKRGCYVGFYDKRCLICEEPMERKNEAQKVCGKRKCKNAFRQIKNDGSVLGRYFAASYVTETQKQADSIDSNRAPKTDRTWRMVAGPALTPKQFHCATVPDGPNWQWTDGTYQRTEDKSRRALEAHFGDLDKVVLDACAACGREDDLKDLPFGDRWLVLCHSCLDDRREAHRKASQVTTPVVSHDFGDLSIPDFLRRTPPQEELRQAA